MFDDQDPLLNIIHSIPANSHSVAHATRRPTAGYTQQSKYAPDYGGILETPMTNLKIRSLEEEMPFRPKPRRIDLSVSNEFTSQIRPTTEDCVAAVSYLENVDRSEKFSVIRVLGRHLHVDLVNNATQVDDGIDSPSSICYAHVPYSEIITGIKLVPIINDMLLVKFDQGIKVIKLNASYQISQGDCDSSDTSSDDLNSVEKEPALGFVTTFQERLGLQVKDTCINPFNRTILGVASENSKSRVVKLYDLSSGSHQSYHSILWASEDPSAGQGQQLISAASDTSARILRRRVVRSFAPMQPHIIEGVRQFDHIPSHLSNMMLTNARQVILIDPRLDKPGQIYVDKSEIPSFYPLEYLRRSEFSVKNTYQFYSLSNIHIRVFDTRFPCTPMSQISHMLESETYDVMNMKIIPYDESHIETVCSSSLGRLSFLTFDHERADRLANPSSSHHPYHEPGPAELSNNESEELFGLAIVSEPLESSSSSLFSVLQLSASGTVCYRKFESRDCEADLNLTNHENHPFSLAQRANESKLQGYTQETVENDSDSTEAGIYDSDTEIDASGQSSDSDNEIDILDHSNLTNVADKVESNRAKESYQKMKNKLGVDN